MANIIHVTPAKLKSSAQTFQTTAGEVKNLTTSMTNTVAKLSGRVWSGEAGSAYTSKFNAMQGDINRLYQMITKHTAQLNQIAAEYEKAETANLAEAGGLPTAPLG